MAEQIPSQQQPLCATLLALRKRELMLINVEFTTLDLFTQVMKPLVQVEAIGAEKWIITSTLWALLYQLLSVYFLPGAEDTNFEKSMKRL